MLYLVSFLIYRYFRSVCKSQPNWRLVIVSMSRSFIPRSKMESFHRLLRTTCIESWLITRIFSSVLRPDISCTPRLMSPTSWWVGWLVSWCVESIQHKPVCMLVNKSNLSSFLLRFFSWVSSLAKRTTGKNTTLTWNCQLLWIASKKCLPRSVAMEPTRLTICASHCSHLNHS